jgi:hypothetical protein
MVAVHEVSRQVSLSFVAFDPAFEVVHTTRNLLMPLGVFVDRIDRLGADK